MDQEIIKIALLIILSLGFVFTVNKNYILTIKIYAMQAFFIFAIMIFLEKEHLTSNMFLFIGIITGLALRVIVLPGMMIHFLKKEKFHLVEREFKIPVFWSMIIELILFIFIYFISKQIFGKIDPVYLISLSLIVFGFIVSFNHKKLFGNVLSLLMIENALFLLSVFLLGGIPIFIELGILVDVIFGFLVSIIALVKIKAIDEKMEIDSMSNLKEVF